MPICTVTLPRGIRKGADRTGEVHAQYLDGFTKLKIRRLMCFLWLFAAQRRSCGCILDLLPEALSFFFHLCDAEIFSLPNLWKLRIVSSATSFASLRIAFAFSFASLMIRSLCSSSFCLSLGCLLLQAFSLAAVRCDLFPLFFDRAAACLKIAQQILKGDILFAQPFFRILDNVVRQPQFAGYGKRIALPGDSDEQAGK